METETKGAWRDGNRRDSESGGMETEEKGILEECKQKRPAWRNGNIIDRKPRGMETEETGRLQGLKLRET